MTASGAIQWARVLTRVAVGTTGKSPLVQTTRAKRIDVRMKKAMPYELDVGACKKTKRFKIKVVPSAVTIRVPTPPSPDGE
jgi:diacylglycerol kinase (ATP)